MKKKVDLTNLSTQIRKDILTFSVKANMGHIGSALSVVEILTSLYFEILNIDPKNPNWDERDRFIYSKGHAALAYYTTLSHRGFFSKTELDTYCKNGSKFNVHPEYNGVPGVDFGAGSLGHGLSVGIGMAYAAKVKKQNFNVYILLSDAELNEGSVWEALLFANHHKLDNLKVVVDYNNSQAMGKGEEVLNLAPLPEKLKSFGWNCLTVDGHSLSQITQALLDKTTQPTIVVAQTTIGKGISFMEGKFEWHYLNPTLEMYQQGLQELDSQMKKTKQSTRSKKISKPFVIRT